MRIEHISPGQIHLTNPSCWESYHPKRSADVGRRARPFSEWTRRAVSAEELVELCRSRDTHAIVVVELEPKERAERTMMLQALGNIQAHDDLYILITGVGDDESIGAQFYEAGADELHATVMPAAWLRARLERISEQLFQRQALREMAAHFEEMELFGKLGTWVWDARADKSYWSSHLYKVYDLNPEEGPVRIQDQYALVHKDDRDFARDQAANALKNKQPGELWVRVTLPNQSMRMIHGRFQPILSKSGEVLGLRGINKNIEQTRQTEAHLRRQTQILGYISDYLPGALFQIRQKPDRSFWLEYLSLGQLDNFLSLQDHLGQTFSESPIRLFEEDIAHMIKTGDEAIDTLSPWEDEFRVYDDNQELRWIAGRSAPEIDDDGSIVWRGAMFDVTEQKLLTEQVQRADRLATIGTMAAGIAHEVNNPLTTLMGYLQMSLSGLDQYLDAQPDAQEQLKVPIGAALKSAQRIRTVVEELMSFGRSTPDGDELVAVERVAQSAARMLNTQLRDRAQISLEYEELEPVLANSGQLRQVLVNLILNAAQSMPARPRAENHIHVRLHSDAQQVYIEVEDNGRGIKPGDMDHLFEPFFSTKPAGEGAGLGLYVCRQLIEAMGGRLEAESVPAEGSTFRIILNKRS